MPAPPAPRILIVDDQPALTKSLCDTLGAEGYETVGCNSGQAALEALANLSKKTQVIFFTHHEHLARLAQQTIGQDLLFLHTLTARQGLK